MLVTLDASDFADKGGLFFSTLVQGAKAAVLQQANASVARFKTNAYWKQGTRKTANSFKVQRTGAMSAEVRSDYKIAHFLNVGTRAHYIWRDKAPALTFFWAKMGRIVSFKRVSHPGTKKLAIDKKEAFVSLAEMLQKADASRDAAIDRSGLG